LTQDLVGARIVTTSFVKDQPRTVAEIIVVRFTENDTLSPYISKAVTFPDAGGFHSVEVPGWDFPSGACLFIQIYSSSNLLLIGPDSMDVQGVNKYRFGEGLKLNEQQWLVSEINSHLEVLRGHPINYAAFPPVDTMPVSMGWYDLSLTFV
jgi:hypothetical protein